ncbi:hypothetical protein [Allorhizobium undicola]|uniref:hypothetical protein n=1 Tax=Allorhizobium undicola TaxID=78527 RepID=UPI000484B593|nr:hypothetical protein [Allorhizobium undicola]
MILEALNYAATWKVTTPPHRPFIRSSIDLWSRARRCKAQWAEHEENTRRAILAAASAASPRRTAVILGSGLLRDVPIRPLAAAFDTVVLIDLVHVASVRAWLAAQGLKNIRLIERDLSGYDLLQAGRPVEPLDFLRRVPYLDFVASANLLSQIGRGVKRRMKLQPDAAMPEDAVSRLIHAHVEGLAQLPAKTCLVTDTSFDLIDRNGVLRESTDLMAGVKLPPQKAEWRWPVAPPGEESRDYRIEHHVGAWF